MHKGKLLKEIIRKSGYSLAKLARRLKISRNTLYRRLDEEKVSDEFINAIINCIGYKENETLWALQELPSKRVNQNILYVCEHCSDVPVIYLDALAQVVRLLIDSKSTSQQVMQSILGELVQTTTSLRSKHFSLTPPDKL